jgi:hypothetical protein
MALKIKSTNIDSTTTFTFANLTVSGNITSGNANLGNLITSNYSTAVLTTGAQPNITGVGLLANLTVGNATANSVFGNGTITVTSNITTSGLLIGNNIVSSVVSITGTTTLTSTAFGKLHQCSGTSANYAVTLPAASGNAGKIISFQMVSGLTKLVTITGNGSETIDGSNTRIMWANETAVLYCDGTSWTKIGGKTIPMIGAMYKSGATQTVATATDTKIVTQSVSSFDTGVSGMADTTNSRIIIQRAGRYNIFVCSRITNISTNAGHETRIYKSTGIGVTTTELSIVSKYSTSGDWPPCPLNWFDNSTVGSVYEVWGKQFSGTNQGYFACLENGIYVTEIPQW